MRNFVPISPFLMQGNRAECSKEAVRLAKKKGIGNCRNAGGSKPGDRMCSAQFQDRGIFQIGTDLQGEVSADLIQMRAQGRQPFRIIERMDRRGRCQTDSPL